MKSKVKVERKGFVERFKNVPAHTWRLGVLTFVEILVFVGVVSLIQADPVIKYTLATVIVVFTAKELY